LSIANCDCRFGNVGWKSGRVIDRPGRMDIAISFCSFLVFCLDIGTLPSALPQGWASEATTLPVCFHVCGSITGGMRRPCGQVLGGERSDIILLFRGRNAQLAAYRMYGSLLKSSTSVNNRSRVCAAHDLLTLGDTFICKGDFVIMHLISASWSSSSIPARLGDTSFIGSLDSPSLCPKDFQDFLRPITYLHLLLFLNKDFSHLGSGGVS